MGFRLTVIWPWMTLNLGQSFNYRREITTCLDLLDHQLDERSIDNSCFMERISCLLWKSFIFASCVSTIYPTPYFSINFPSHTSRSATTFNNNTYKKLCPNREAVAMQGMSKYYFTHNCRNFCLKCCMIIAFYAVFFDVCYCLATKSPLSYRIVLSSA